MFAPTVNLFSERERGDVACYPLASLPSPFPLGDRLGIAPYRFTFLKKAKDSSALSGISY
jgi:hypothetical protein